MKGAVQLQKDSILSCYATQSHSKGVLKDLGEKPFFLSALTSPEKPLLRL